MILLLSYFLALPCLPAALSSYLSLLFSGMMLLLSIISLLYFFHLFSATNSPAALAPHVILTHRILAHSNLEMWTHAQLLAAGLTPFYHHLLTSSLPHLLVTSLSPSYLVTLLPLPITTASWLLYFLVSSLNYVLLASPLLPVMSA